MANLLSAVPAYRIIDPATGDFKSASGMPPRDSTSTPSQPVPIRAVHWFDKIDAQLAVLGMNTGEWSVRQSVVAPAPEYLAQLQEVETSECLRKARMLGSTFKVACLKEYNFHTDKVYPQEFQLWYNGKALYPDRWNEYEYSFWLRAHSIWSLNYIYRSLGYEAQNMAENGYEYSTYYLRICQIREDIKDRVYELQQYSAMQRFGHSISRTVKKMKFRRLREQAELKKQHSDAQRSVEEEFYVHQPVVRDNKPIRGKPKNIFPAEQLVPVASVSDAVASKLKGEFANEWNEPPASADDYTFPITNKIWDDSPRSSVALTDDLSLNNWNDSASSNASLGIESAELPEIFESVENSSFEVQQESIGSTSGIKSVRFDLELSSEFEEPEESISSTSGIKSERFDLDLLSESEGPEESISSNTGIKSVEFELDLSFESGPDESEECHLNLPGLDIFPGDEGLENILYDSEEPEEETSEEETSEEETSTYSSEEDFSTLKSNEKYSGFRKGGKEPAPVKTRKSVRFELDLSLIVEEDEVIVKESIKPEEEASIPKKLIKYDMSILDELINSEEEVLEEINSQDEESCDESNSDSWEASSEDEDSWEDIDSEEEEEEEEEKEEKEEEILPEELINLENSSPEKLIKSKTSLPEEMVNLENSSPEELIKFQTSLPEEMVNLENSSPEELIKSQTSTPEESIKLENFIPEELTEYDYSILEELINSEEEVLEEINSQDEQSCDNSDSSGASNSEASGSESEEIFSPSIVEDSGSPDIIEGSTEDSKPQEITAIDDEASLNRVAAKDPTATSLLDDDPRPVSAIAKPSVTSEEEFGGVQYEPNPKRADIVSKLEMFFLGSKTETKVEVPEKQVRPTVLPKKKSVSFAMPSAKKIKLKKATGTKSSEIVARLETFFSNNVASIGGDTVLKKRSVNSEDKSRVAQLKRESRGFSMMAAKKQPSNPVKPLLAKASTHSPKISKLVAMLELEFNGGC